MARRFVTHGPVESALSIAELRHRARRRLPAFVFEYLEGGAEDEVTLRRNRAVFEAIAFLPRTLVPGGTVEAGTTLFGRSLALPLVVAPTGFCGLFRRDGDLYLARAAAASGIPFCQSTVSNARLETVSAVRDCASGCSSTCSAPKPSWRRSSPAPPRPAARPSS